MFGQLQVSTPAVSPMSFTTPTVSPATWAADWDISSPGFGPAGFTAPGIGPGTVQLGGYERWGRLGPSGDPAMSVQDQMISPAPLVGLGQAEGFVAAGYVVSIGVGAALGLWLARNQKVRKKQRWMWGAGGAGAGWLAAVLFNTSGITIPS